MTRLVYALAWWAVAPLAVVRLWWRGRKQPGYRAAIRERFGRYAPCAPGPRIWIHAVSLGETRAAAPIVEALAARHPNHRILLTHMTPTGRAAGEELFGDRVERAWLPYDLRFAVRAFVRHFRPEMGILIETELWPRLIAECKSADIPVALANARLSERSARRYARFPGIARWAIENLAGIAAQTPADAHRFVSLGAAEVEVIGNVMSKPNILVAEDESALITLLRYNLEREGYRVLEARDGEEALLLDAFAAMPAEVLLVIVPRHPQRFDEVAQLAASRGFETARRSMGAAVPASTRVVIGDTMGEMLAYYAASDLVLMGGSFLDYGSQNLIEACALGRPVIMGRHTYNFEQAAEGALAVGAAIRVEDAGKAVEAALGLTRDGARRERMGASAREFVAAHRGATRRLVDWLEGTSSRARARG